MRSERSEDRAMDLNLLSLCLIVIFPFQKKEKEKGTANAGRRCSKTYVKACVENALAARTYARSLEREVYAFLSTLDKRDERVRGDCCGPAFFVCGRAAEAWA